MSWVVTIGESYMRSFNGHHTSVTGAKWMTLPQLCCTRPYNKHISVISSIHLDVPCIPNIHYCKMIILMTLIY